MSELILYTSDDGEIRLDLRVDGRTVWLTQLEIAELFQTTKQNISLHAKNIFEDGELTTLRAICLKVNTFCWLKMAKTLIHASSLSRSSPRGSFGSTTMLTF